MTLEKKNIILITIDCLRYDFVGHKENNRSITPNLDKLVKDGAYFTQAIVNGPSTPFSFPSIFFSSYALMDSKFPFVSESKVSLAGALSEHGYETAGFNSNPYLSKYYHYDKGFDYYYDSIKMVKKPLNGNHDQSFIRNFLNKHNKLKKLVKKVLVSLHLRNKIKLPYERAGSINSKALKWIRERKGNFFTWIHYMDTHHPFVPPKSYRNLSNRQVIKSEILLAKNPPNVSKKQLKILKQSYIGTIKYVDHEIGNIITELERMNLLKNTLLIITADHGEEFREHGGFSHHAKLYEELIHVPLVFNGQGIPTNRTINELVALIDLSPTILEYIGLKPNDNFYGKSFLPLLKDTQEDYEREGVISETLIKNGKVNLLMEKSFQVICYRTTRWKLIINFGSNVRELYNLLEDPEEKHNVYDNNPELVVYFEKLIEKHLTVEKERKELMDVSKKIFLSGV